MDWIKTSEEMPDLYNCSAFRGSEVYYYSDMVYIKKDNGDIYIGRVVIEGVDCYDTAETDAPATGKPIKFTDVPKNGYRWRDFSKGTVIIEWKPLEEKIKQNHH